MMKKIWIAVGVAVIFCVTADAFGIWDKKKPEKTVVRRVEDPLLRYCCLRQQMNEYAFNTFLTKMSLNRKKMILQAGNPEYKGPYTKEAIWDKILWESSHWITYPFKNKVEYHEIVKWIAQKAGFSEYFAEGRTTFQLERKILERIVQKNWDRLTQEQRLIVLKDLDPENKIKNKAGIAALTGAAASAALIEAINLSGFGFYMAAACMMKSVAGIVGVTLPFVLYQGTSIAVATLTGPIGWSVMGLTLLGGSFFVGQADATETAKLIIGVHCVKVDAIQKSGLNVDDYL